MITLATDSILKAVKQVYRQLVPKGVPPSDKELELEDSATIVIEPCKSPAPEAVLFTDDALCYSFDYQKLFPYAKDIVTPAGKDIVSWEMEFWNSDFIRPSPEAPEGRLRHTVELLRVSPNSRRALISLWRPEVHERSPYAPCVTHVVFRVKRDRLEMHGHLRTNDICFLLFMDMQVMSGVHQVAADWLGLRKGLYVHFVDSLHIHKKYFDMVRRQYAYMLENPAWTRL